MDDDLTKLERAVAARPQDREARRRLGLLLAQAGRVAEGCVHCFRSGLAVEPELERAAAAEQCGALRALAEQLPGAVRVAVGEQRVHAEGTLFNTTYGWVTRAKLPFDLEVDWRWRPLEEHLQASPGPPVLALRFVQGQLPGGRPIDAADVALLLGLTALVRLELEGPVGAPRGPWLDLSPLGRLPLLEVLTIGREYEPRERPWLEGLQLVAFRSGFVALRMLGLYDALIEDHELAHLASFRLLEELRLDGGPIRGDGLDHLARLPRLRRLDLVRTRLDECSSLGALSGLTHLRLLEGSKVVPAIAGHPALRTLVLGRAELTRRDLEVLAALPRLTRLELQSCTGLDDASLLALARSASLQEVELRDGDVTHAGAQRLQQLMPRAHVHCRRFEDHEDFVGP